MSNPSDDDLRHRIKQNGLEALGRLHNDLTWEDWMAARAALELITEEAMAAQRSPKWDANDRRLVKEFNRRWDEYESGVGGNHKPISKQERWSLREITNNPEIPAWRAALTGPEKRKLNHPNNVINRWKAREKRKAIPDEDKPPSPFEKMRRANVELQEELHQRNKNGDGNTFTKDSKAKDVATAIVGTFEALPSGVSRIESIARELLAWVKARKKKKAA